ncbi:MAG: ferric reductase-like transmembrane domain-containing protein [Ardenticatenia bacterium]|nr:ferric reductase-like transmembrane domain-containing protein [Ardenticatenia bacterium]
MTTAQGFQDFDQYPPAVAFQTVMLMLVAAAVGAIAAVFVVPTWLPGLSASLLGESPKVYWYLARSSGVTAYVLLWFSMAFGVMMTNKMARVWPGGPTAFDLHQYTSLLGLTFALFHAIILLGDTYIEAGLTNVLTPFGYTGYRPLWVGIGQVAFYLMAVIAFSFYVRQLIGRRMWRLLHYLSFITFVAALGHGIMAGTDTSSAFMQGLYWTTGGGLLFLTLYRMLVGVWGWRQKAARRKRKAHAVPSANVRARSVPPSEPQDQAKAGAQG